MIEELLSTNQLYTNNVDRWRFLYASYVGGKQYREAGYLTRYQLETDKEYIARCEATPLDNQCKSVISVYNSFLFKEEPERKFDIISPDVYEFLEDADLEGRTLTNFMKEVSTWSQVFGHCWVMVCKPNIDAASLAEEQALGIRPYVSLLTPLTVLDWTWERKPCGKYQLSYFKYVEEVNGSTQTYKEWTNDIIKTTILDETGKELLEQYEEYNQLGMIPAVISYADRSIIRGLGISSIDDIADIQRYIYNALSEADQSIRLDSHPSLVATPDTEIGTGAGSIIQIPENIDPGLKPYILDFNGASIDSIYTVITNSQKTIEQLASIGGVRTTFNQSRSGIALQTEFQLLNTKLSSIADNLENAEEQIWKIFYTYQQREFNMEVEYPDSFEFQDDEKEIDKLQKAKNAATSPELLAMIDNEIARWMGVEIVHEIDEEIIEESSEEEKIEP